MCKTILADCNEVVSIVSYHNGEGQASSTRITHCGYGFHIFGLIGSKCVATSKVDLVKKNG